MAKKSSKKLDPKKIFAVMTITRETIADQLNAAIDAVGSDVPEFTKDDPRLTDEVCQDFADSLYDAYVNTDDDALNEAEHEMYIDSLEQFS